MKMHCSYVLLQLIQDEIKALVQLQNQQHDAQAKLSGTAKTSDPEILAFSPAPRPFTKSSVTHKESQDECLLTIQSSGYGTFSTWERETMEEKNEVTASYKKLEDGSRSIPSRTASLNDALHKTSTVPKLTADHQQRTNW